MSPLRLPAYPHSGSVQFSKSKVPMTESNLPKNLRASVNGPRPTPKKNFTQKIEVMGKNAGRLLHDTNHYAVRKNKIKGSSGITSNPVAKKLTWAVKTQATGKIDVGYRLIPDPGKGEPQTALSRRKSLGLHWQKIKYCSALDFQNMVRHRTLCFQIAPAVHAWHL